jgi:hypothetical protein
MGGVTRRVWRTLLSGKIEVPFRPFRVKTAKYLSEQMFSGFASKSGPPSVDEYTHF